MANRIFNLRRWGMCILCAFALLFAGTSFEPILSVGGQLGPAELAQYRLPDGSLPILCITVKDSDGKSQGKTFSQSCQLYQVAADFVLPAPPVEAFRHFALSSPVLPRPKYEAFYRQLYPPNTGPRAPPYLGNIG